MKSPLHTFTTAAGKTIQVFVQNRRCYGGSDFYTWLYATDETGQVIRDWTNDPWPCVRPPRSGVLWSLHADGTLDIPPDAADIRWIRRQQADRRITHVSQADATRYTEQVAA